MTDVINITMDQLSPSQRRLNALRVANPVLTELAKGYYNGAFIAEKILPVVPVDAESGDVPVFGRDAFLIHDTIREIRSKSNRLTPGDIGSDRYTLAEHDLEYPIDYRERQEASFDIKIHATYITKQGIDLKKEVETAQLLTNPKTYPDANHRALSGSEHFDLPTSNPVRIIDDAKKTIKRLIGINPNKMVLPENIFNALKSNPFLLAKQKRTEIEILDKKDLEHIFEIDEILIGEASYLKPEEDNADITIPADVWGNIIILAYSPSPNDKQSLPVALYTPSFGYLLKKKEKGIFTDEYVENGGKITVIRTTEIFQAKVMCNYAGYLITDVLSEKQE